LRLKGLVVVDHVLTLEFVTRWTEENAFQQKIMDDMRKVQPPYVWIHMIEKIIKFNSRRKYPA
jgi:hypothetical protein